MPNVWPTLLLTEVEEFLESRDARPLVELTVTADPGPPDQPRACSLRAHQVALREYWAGVSMLFHVYSRSVRHQEGPKQAQIRIEKRRRALVRIGVNHEAGRFSEY